MTSPARDPARGATLTSSAPPHAVVHSHSRSTSLTGRALLATWVLSIGVHAILFTLMVTFVFPFTGRDPQPETSEPFVEVIGPIDGSAFVSSPDPDLADRAVPVETSLPVIEPKPFTDLSELTSTKRPDLPIIGIGEGGGDFAQLGLTLGGPTAPEFFGVGKDARGARKLIYVVDRSGSMIDTFGHVQAELRRSISALRRSQKFHVLFFNAGPPLENPPRRLVSAIDAHKEAFFEFLSKVTPRGQTRPEAALRRALAMQPDLIYLLSDGDDFPPNLVRKLNEWNEARRVRIYTIAYLNRLGRSILEQIAREHNGEFSFVSEHDLP